MHRWWIWEEYRWNYEKIASVTLFSTRKKNEERDFSKTPRAGFPGQKTTRAFLKQLERFFISSTNIKLQDKLDTPS